MYKDSVERLWSLWLGLGGPDVGNYWAGLGPAHMRTRGMALQAAPSRAALRTWLPIAVRTWLSMAHAQPSNAPNQEGLGRRSDPLLLLLLLLLVLGIVEGHHYLTVPHTHPGGAATAAAAAAAASHRILRCRRHQVLLLLLLHLLTGGRRQLAGGELEPQAVGGVDGGAGGHAHRRLLGVR